MGEEKRNAFRAARRSRTMWFSMFLAFLGVLQTQSDWMTEYLTPKEMGLTLALIAAVVAALRIATTEALMDKDV